VKGYVVGFIVMVLNICC